MNVNIDEKNNKIHQFFVKNKLTQLVETNLDVQQQNEYPLSESNVGILVGKITANQGVAIPNAKISIFIASTEEDNVLSEIYPYKSVNDKNEDGYRYNLLKKNKDVSDKSCYSPTGSFFSTSEIINDEYKNTIFKKYYKFNATTNELGDYLIEGLPVGNNFIHVDVDVSDISFLSQKPYDFIANGSNPKSFKSYSEFNVSNNLDTLPQIFSYDSNVEILPQWSQLEKSGITQFNIEMPLEITPTAFLIFGNFTDSIKGAIGKNSRPRKKTGRNCDLESKGGTITILRRLTDNGTEVEYLEQQQFNLDQDGNAVIPIPLNLNKKISDVNGNLIPSLDNKKGIATTAKIRIKITLDDYEAIKKRTAHYLIPNLYNDFRFNDETLDRDFFEVEWNGLYTVQNFIPRVQKNKQENNDNFLGIKRIGICEDNLSIPFNRIQSEFNILYSILCIIINAFVAIAGVLDTLALGSLKYTCEGVEYNKAKDWRDDCVMPKIAEFFGVIEYEFYNDFLTGSLYHFKYKFKSKYKRNKDAIYYKYSAYNCADYVSSNDPSYKNKCKDLYIVDRQDFNNGVNYFQSNESTRHFKRGLIVEYNNEFFYAARNDVEINQEDTLSLNLNSINSEKNKLLFATNLLKIGHTEKCSHLNKFYFVDKLSSTSFEEEEGNRLLYDISSFTACFKPDDIQEDKIYKICQYGIELIGGDDEDFNTNEYYFDHDLTLQREYLSNNFNPYMLNNIYVENAPITVTDQDGEDFIIENNYIQNLEEDGILRSVTPFYHYFGLKGNNTSLDIAKRNFLCQ